MKSLSLEFTCLELALHANGKTTRILVTVFEVKQIRKAERYVYCSSKSSVSLFPSSFDAGSRPEIKRFHKEDIFDN